MCLLRWRMGSALSREALLLVKSNSPSKGQLCLVSCHHSHGQVGRESGVGSATCDRDPREV